MFRIIPLLILSLVLSICATAQLNTGIVAHWDFSGNANDISGNGLNGTSFNVSYTAGKSGNANTALQLNGTSSYVSAPFQNVLNVNTFSICAVVKVNGFYSGLCETNAILWRGTQFTNGYYSLIYFDNPFDSQCGTFSPTQEVFAGQVSNLTSGPNTPQWYYTPTIVTQRWYCVITTFDGTQTKVYVDGALMSTHTVLSGSLGSSNEGLTIGKTFTNPAYPYWMNGAIDDLRIYNRVLSNTDISAYCNLFPPAAVPQPEVSISQPVNPTSFCPGANFVLHYTVTLPFNGGNAFTAQLSDATGSFTTPVNIGANTATGAGTINCTIPANTPPGTGYRIRVVASNPAKTSANNGVNLTVYSAAQLNLFGDTAVCIGDTLKLNAQVTPPGTLVQWSGPNGFADTGLLAIIQGAGYDDSGMYIVTANYNGCTAIDTITAIIGDAKFELGNDTLVCSDAQVKLYTGVRGASHLWQDGSTQDTFIVTQGGRYTVTTSLGSCKHSDSIDIAIQQVGLQLPNDSVLCPNSSFPLSVTDTFDTYLWSTMNTGPSIPIEKGGLYWLRVSKGKCFAADSMYVKMLEPYFLLGNDTTLCNGRTLVLRANSIEGSNYTWQDGSNNQTFTVKEKGFYYVSAQNICGTFQSNINVDYYQCECYPVMPTAFTPNGDGLNDDIGPIMSCTPKDFKYVIVNRWGEVVFETEEFGKRWDGKHYRIPADISTYFYMIQVTDVLGNKTMHKGDILLLR